MVSDQDKKKGWDHRYYDSYRPAAQHEASSAKRSMTLATISGAVRYQSNKSWHQAKTPSNKKPQGDASSNPKSSRGQYHDRNSPATSVPDNKSPFTGHDPEKLTGTASQECKGTAIPDAAPSRPSSRALDAEKETHESEAQSRGFYASSRSQTLNAVHIGRYELKRRQGDEETDRSPKRTRGDDEDDQDRLADRPRNAEENELVRASDNYKLCCKNYMCMGDHSYQYCEKPMICWGCRSTGHYWSHCPMTCTRCEATRHTAQYCDDFSLSPSGKSRPRACHPHPSHRAQRESLEHAQGEISLPTKPEKVVPPNHAPKKASERARLRALHNTFDANSNNALRVQQQSEPKDKGTSPTDRPLQGLREPEPSSSPSLRTTGNSKQLTISTQAPGNLATPPSTQPNISPLDPRLRRRLALTPLVSPLQSLDMSLEPGEIPSIKSQMLGEPPPNYYQHRPLGVGASPSQASGLPEQYQSFASTQREAYVPPASSRRNEDVSQASGRKDDDHSTALTRNEGRPSRPPSRVDGHSSQALTRNEDYLVRASAPNEHSADVSLEAIKARMEAFEEEERIKQKEHEEELARKAQRQKMEFQHEFEEILNQKKHDAEMARKATIQRQAEEHERRLAELRRL